MEQQRADQPEIVAHGLGKGLDRAVLRRRGLDELGAGQELAGDGLQGCHAMGQLARSAEAAAQQRAHHHEHQQHESADEQRDRQGRSEGQREEDENEQRTRSNLAEKIERVAEVLRFDNEGGGEFADASLCEEAPARMEHGAEQRVSPQGHVSLLPARAEPRLAEKDCMLKRENDNDEDENDAYALRDAERAE